MILWRISRHRDLSGMGGLKAAGRWHHAGHAIVYMTETPASALLEVCVHTSASDVPPKFTLLKIEGPDMEVPSIKSVDLRRNWQTQLEVTGDLGTAWLKKNESVLLRIPSVIVPETVNFLFNPSHKLAPKFRISDTFPYPFDLRLKR
jgi:RES domain-containing protein